MPGTTSLTIPDYAGGSLVNLVAELEHRLVGSSAGPGLHPPLAGEIPEAATYVVVLLDGLGADQLSHPQAVTLAGALRATLDAPFPTTTTVSLATVATGLPPSQHGLLGYQLWMPEVGGVVNTIKWTTLWGDPLDVDTEPLLPAPNLWERLRAGGVEPVTVQPHGFATSPLTRLLYRGCRFEGISTVAELVAATVQLAAVPGRLILTYLPQVDFAAHVHGQRSQEYAAAVATVDHAWSALAARLPPGVVLVGTSDHGHVDFPKERQLRIPKAMHDDRRFYGDSRVMFVLGDGESIAKSMPATWLPGDEMETWWGPPPHHPAFAERRPDGVLVVDDDHVLLHKHSDERMTGHHGGLTAAERRIPLLVHAASAQ